VGASSATASSVGASSLAFSASGVILAAAESSGSALLVFTASGVGYAIGAVSPFRSSVFSSRTFFTRGVKR
jgi:hypothetical protein